MSEQCPALRPTSSRTKARTAKFGTVGGVDCRLDTVVRADECPRCAQPSDAFPRAL